MLPKVESPAAAVATSTGTLATDIDSIDEAPLRSMDRSSWTSTANNGGDSEMDDWAITASLLPSGGRRSMPGTSVTSTAVGMDVFDSRNDGGSGGGGGLAIQTSPLFLKNKNSVLMVQPSKQQQRRPQLQQSHGTRSSMNRSNSSKPRPKQKNRPKRRRPRQQQRTEAENDLFTSFTLNRDPQNSKYLPYDEVVYPKLFNRPKEARRPQPPPPLLQKPAEFFLAPAATTTARSRVVGKPTAALEPFPARRMGNADEQKKKDLAMVAAAELDSMWVVGFVEDARRNQKDLLLRDLRDFVRLPGSTVLPGAHAALDTINLMKKPTSFNSYSSSPPSSKTRAKSADDRERRARNGADDDNDNSAESVSGAREPRPAAGKNALTDLECLRLRELEKRLSQESRGVKDEDVCHHAGVQAYGAANRKLRKILGGARPPAMGPVIKSEGLEAVFRRNREERAAASRIQALFKHYYRRKRFEQMILQLQGVVKIQALARGVIARRFVAEWYARRSVMVLAWQKIIRRMLSNIRWRRRLALEQRAASRIQAAERGRAGRRKARSIKVNLAALRIQCLWRGSVDRARVDRIWLGALATRIQGLARVLVAKRVVGRTRRICNAAARSIQRSFRGTVARKAMVRLIWARSMARRQDFLRVLAAEEEWERENIEITQRRSRRMMLEEKLGTAVEAEAAVHAVVFELEVNFLNNHRISCSLGTAVSYSAAWRGAALHIWFARLLTLVGAGRQMST